MHRLFCVKNVIDQCLKSFFDFQNHLSKQLSFNSKLNDRFFIYFHLNRFKNIKTQHMNFVCLFISFLSHRVLTSFKFSCSINWIRFNIQFFLISHRRFSNLCRVHKIFINNKFSLSVFVFVWSSFFLSFVFFVSNSEFSFVDCFFLTEFIEKFDKKNVKIDFCFL